MAWSATGSRHLARRARPASPTYLLRSWGTNPAWHKEQLDEYSIECHERIFHPVARNRAGGSSDVLVDSTRTLGEPFHLYRATGRRRCFFIRLRDQHGSHTEPHRRIAARPGAAARITHH